MARVEPYVKVTEVIKDFPTLLAIDGDANIACTIVSPVGPKLAYIQGPNEFLRNYTKDGVTIPRDSHITFINAYYLSFFSGLVIARSMNSNATGGLEIYYKAASGGASEQFYTYPAYFMDGVELTKSRIIGISNFPAAGGNWGLIIDEVIYYGGNLQEVLALFRTAGDEPAAVDLSGLEAVACDTLYDETSTDTYQVQCLDQLVAELNKLDTYTVLRNVSGIQVYRDDWTDAPLVDKVDLLNSDGELVETAITPVAVTVTVPASDTLVITPESGAIKLFTIIDKTPGSIGSNPNKVTISKTRVLAGHKVFDLTLKNGTNDAETYVVSLDPEAVDSSEVNCFIEQLNSIMALEFTFKAEEGLANQTWASSAGPISFGAGFCDPEVSATTPYLKQALDTLEDQELYDIAYLAPVGITSVPYIKTYTSMGKRNKWFAPVDVPYDRTNVNSIQAYGNYIDDDYNCYMVGPFDKNAGLTGWIVYIAATTLYYERVMNNRSQQSEFAPVFDKQTGLLNYTDPVKLLKKSAREKLISLIKPINYVIFDQRSGAYYLNDNWTHYSLCDNVVGEEMNVRMAHKISRDLQKLYQQFKAKYNNEQTRRAVCDITALYFQGSIMNQNFKPAEWMIICDETNNTPDIVRSRHLAITVKIRLYNSIKYIDVVNEIYAVGGMEFTA